MYIQLYTDMYMYTYKYIYIYMYMCMYDYVQIHITISDITHWKTFYAIHIRTCCKVCIDYVHENVRAMCTVTMVDKLHIHCITYLHEPST